MRGYIEGLIPWMSCSCRGHVEPGGPTVGVCRLLLRSPCQPFLWTGVPHATVSIHAGEAITWYRSSENAPAHASARHAQLTVARNADGPGNRLARDRAIPSSTSWSGKVSESTGRPEVSVSSAPAS
jgi:hypothetical protein